MYALVRKEEHGETLPFYSFGLRVMSSGEHPLLACTCAVCHTWRRVGFLLVSPDRSEAFRSLALQRIRNLYLELLDVLEGVGCPPPVAVGGGGGPSRAGEARPLEEAQALAEASSKAAPARPPATLGAAAASGAEKEENRGEEKRTTGIEATEDTKKVEEPASPKKKKKKDRRSEKRHKARGDKAIPPGSEDPSVTSQGKVVVEEPKEEVLDSSVLSEADYENDSPLPEEREKPHRCSPSLSRKSKSPERGREVKVQSPERGREPKQRLEEEEPRKKTRVSPESGRGIAGGLAPDCKREDKKEKDQRKEKRRSRSRTRRRRASSPHDQRRERRGEKRASPVSDRRRGDRRGSPERERKRDQGEVPPSSSQGHLRPPEPKFPPRYIPPTSPPPGVFVWAPPYWGRHYGEEHKSKGVKRRERNLDIRRHGLDEDRKLERKSRGG